MTKLKGTRSAYTNEGNSTHSRRRCNGSNDVVGQRHGRLFQYGIEDFEPGISRIETEQGSIVEFPVSTLRAAGRNLPVGGGGYFRLLPGWATRMAVRRITKAGAPANLYLHPWEFDPEQPRVPAPALKKLRHYLNLDRTLDRLDALLARQPFGGLGEVLSGRGWL